MYKKYVMTLIENAIYKEFSYCIKIDDIIVIEYDEYIECVLFKFDSIFENVWVYGTLNNRGEAEFLKNADYTILYKYYRER